MYTITGIIPLLCTIYFSLFQVLVMTLTTPLFFFFFIIKLLFNTSYDNKSVSWDEYNNDDNFICNDAKYKFLELRRTLSFLKKCCDTFSTKIWYLFFKIHFKYNLRYLLKFKNVPDWTRTNDPKVFSLVLYQLSYWNSPPLGKTFPQPSAPGPLRWRGIYQGECIPSLLRRRERKRTTQVIWVVNRKLLFK